MKNRVFFCSVFILILLFGVINYKNETDAMNVVAIELSQSGNSERIDIEDSNSFDQLITFYKAARKESKSIEKIDIASSYTVTLKLLENDWRCKNECTLTIDKNGVILINDELIPRKTNMDDMYLMIREYFTNGSS